MELLGLSYLIHYLEVSNELLCYLGKTKFRYLEILWKLELSRYLEETNKMNSRVLQLKASTQKTSVIITFAGIWSLKKIIENSKSDEGAKSQRATKVISLYL